MDELPERPRGLPPTREEFERARRVRVDFATRGAESFNTYELADGNVIKLKVVLTEVKRLDGIKDPEGKPVYEPSFTMVYAVEVD